MTLFHFYLPFKILLIPQFFVQTRKRDGFGKALGDILLKDNLTTEKLVRNIVAQSFVDARYNVVNEEPENKAIKCNITANKLWGVTSPVLGLLISLQIKR